MNLSNLPNFSTKSTFLAVGLFAVLSVGLFLTVATLQQQQENRSRASGITLNGINQTFSGDPCGQTPTTSLNGLGNTVNGNLLNVTGSNNTINGNVTGSINGTGNIINGTGPAAANIIGTGNTVSGRDACGSGISNPTSTPTLTSMPTSQIVLTPTSGGSIRDASGNIWTLTPTGVIMKNGSPVPGGFRNIIIDVCCIY